MFVHLQFLQKWTKRMLIFVLFGATFFILNQQQNGDRPELKRRIKTILVWNAPQRPEVLIFGTGHDAFVRHNCPVSDCELVNSPYQFPERPITSYDAILFNINDQYGLARRPKFRRPFQRYIFFTQEPPPALKDQNLASYRRFFNWTMTYRNDSDIRLLYGRIRPIFSDSQTAEKVRQDIWRTSRQHHPFSKRKRKKKKKLAAAMISHCHTDGRREDYIRQLKKHIPVDVYGWCDESGLGSGLRCDTHELLTSSPECYDMLDKHYMFYLSFENAICADYVTEKFFQVIDGRRRIVPVVYGGADYRQLAPPHSYIDALRYEPSRLAQLLRQLAANETLYEEYFWWKGHYVVESGLQQMVRHGFCDLCQKLHQDDLQHRSYGSLMPKWHPGRCYRPVFNETRTNVESNRRKWIS